MPYDAQAYVHDADRKALTALKAIPGFSSLVKGFMSVWNEPQDRILNMSTRVKLGPSQLGRYHSMLPPICEKLGIDIPDLYLELNVEPNSYTSGDKNPYIVLTSGLLKAVPEELIPTVLAHECGHIACHHVLYTTMGRTVLYGAATALNSVKLGALVSLPLQVAFYYWMRCSEFSADRAAVLCDGRADAMQRVCLSLAGLDKDIGEAGNISAFLEQARDYRQMIEDSKWNKTLEFMILSRNTHPLTAVRALECEEWYNSDQYWAIAHGVTVSSPKKLESTAPSQAAQAVADLSAQARQAVDGLKKQGMGLLKGILPGADHDDRN